MVSHLSCFSICKVNRERSRKKEKRREVFHIFQRLKAASLSVKKTHFYSLKQLAGILIITKLLKRLGLYLSL